MSGKRSIRVSSRALGERVHLPVYVYDRIDDLRRDARAYSGNDCDDALGVTQARIDTDSGQMVSVLIRLCRGHLGTQVVSHEVHHASTGLYGAHLPIGTSAASVLTHYQEPFAHLHSDLMCRLVDRLYALGYYDQNSAEVAS